MKATITCCRQEKIGLTKDGKSLEAHIDQLVAQQLLKNGHVMTKSNFREPAMLGRTG